jgi:hypothetical protein
MKFSNPIAGVVEDELPDVAAVFTIYVERRSPVISMNRRKV